jgi:uncharacterized OB-fold protein
MKNIIQWGSLVKGKCVECGKTPYNSRSNICTDCHSKILTEKIQNDSK